MILVSLRCIWVWYIFEVRDDWDKYCSLCEEFLWLVKNIVDGKENGVLLSWNILREDVGEIYIGIYVVLSDVDEELMRLDGKIGEEG